MKETMARDSRKFRAIRHEWQDWFSDDFSVQRSLQLQSLMDTGVHYPNKNEGKALRRIMATTGLNEEQVRAIKKYRQELAQAAGPQFRAVHDSVKYHPDRFKSSDQIDREQVAALHSVTTDHKAFPRIWARVQKQRVEDAILAKLSRE